MSAPAADAAPTADATAPAAKGRSVPLALILAVVAGLAAGGGAGFFAVGPALASGIAPAVTATAARARAEKAAKAHGDDGAEDGHGDDADAAAADDEEEPADEEEGGKGKKNAEPAPVYTLDNVVLNPAESGGARFLLLTISFEVKDQATHDAMKARDAEVRDAVLATLGSKTVEQLGDMATRDSLKLELQAAAGKLFKKKAVKRVYFPQFVIQ